MASKYICAFLSLWLSTFTVFAQTKEKTEDFWVIGNSTQLETISFDELTRVFRAQLEYWDNNTMSEVILHQSKSMDATKTAQLFYDGSIRNMQRFWLTMVFSGRARSPKYLDNHQEIVDYVRNTPGSIAIVYDRTGIEDLEIQLTYD